MITKSMSDTHRLEKLAFLAQRRADKLTGADKQSELERSYQRGQADAFAVAAQISRQEGIDHD